MRAIRVERFGGPDVLTLEEIATPEPGPGQARVKLAATGLNFIELYQRRGQYKIPLPWAPGTEGAGVVDAVGPDVTDVKPGDRVASASFIGSYAEYAVTDAWRLSPLPDAVDFHIGAAAMLQGLTAHYLTHSAYPLKSGETALIYSAAGGVGGLLVEVAKLLGARVLAAVGSEAKVAAAKELGADEVFVYRQMDIAKTVRDLTSGEGAHVVYESVGKDTFDASLNSLRVRGYLILFGQSSGPVEPFDPQRLNAGGSLFLTRPTLVHYQRTPEELRWRAQDLLNWISKGQVKVRIDRAFPLAQAGDAQEYLASGVAQGKVILEP
jgi:NADPH2:quinone reductase